MALQSLSIRLLVLSACAFVHGLSLPLELKDEQEPSGRVATSSKHILEKCADSPAVISARDRAVARRIDKLETLREERGLKKGRRLQQRDSGALDKWLRKPHDATEAGYNLNTPLHTIFGSTATCALAPEAFIGSYYVDNELIRSDIRDNEPGIFSHLDVQFVDVNTCQPIPRLLVDVWHSNALGQHSAVDGVDQGGLKSNFGRGVQQSDSDGVVAFDTIFPGHYEGRANHIQVLATADATVHDNGTYTGGTARHVGAMYFDEPLVDVVERVHPYYKNWEVRTSNRDDIFAADETTDGYDPFMKYAYLGEHVSDGLLLWITIGLDPQADYNKNVNPIFHHRPDGSVPVEDLYHEYESGRRDSADADLR